MLAECKAKCSRWLSCLFGRLSRRGILDCFVSRTRTRLLPDQHQVGSGLATQSTNGTVIWWWTTKWMTSEERQFVEVPTPSFQIDRVLVAIGLVDSRSNAQRLIKGGGVTWRKDDMTPFQDAGGKWWVKPTEWEKVKDFKQEIPAGWPFILRIGDGMYRTVMVDVPGRDGKPVSKPRMFPSVGIVMKPSGKNQTIQFFSKMWREN